MSKITLSNVSDLTNSTTAQNTINSNAATVQSAFDNTLSRDGTFPNTMGAVLDMNSFNIINLPTPISGSSPARLVDIVSNPTLVLTIPTVGTSGSTVPLLNGINTWSALQTYTTGIVISPSVGTAQAFNTTQVVTGAISTVLNSFQITLDQGTAGSGFSNGWVFEHQFGGGVTTGGRQAGLFELIQNAATNASNSNRQYSPLNSIMLANSGDGGGSGTELGFYYAFNPYMWLKSAATHVVQAQCAEFDIECDSGCSVLEKYGLKISQAVADAVQGSSNDAAIAGVNGSGAVGWKNFIQLGDGVSGRQPLASTGTILLLKGSPTIGSGIDLSAATITNNAFKSTGFTVDGSGNVSGVGINASGVFTGASLTTTGIHTLLSGTAVPAGGTTGSGLKMSSTANLGVFFGSGAPTLSAAQGSLYIRTDGSSTSTRLYVNSTGSTTWVNFTSAS